jgi:hypothetical protein
MTLEYRVAPLPATWPGTQTPNGERKRAPFKATFTRTHELLAREVRLLGGTDVVLHVDVDEYHIRNDGKLRSDARRGRRRSSSRSPTSTATA